MFTLAPCHKGKMTTIKFVVKVNRTGAQIPAYVKSMAGDSIQMTSNRKRALVMGKFAAQDAMDAIRNPRSTPELVMVRVSA
jgi:hypothetical protein